MQIAEAAAGKAHAEHAPRMNVRRNRRLSVQHQGVRSGDARWTFAQRAGRQGPAVTDAALIHDNDLDVALQTQMLQSVVGDQHIAVRMRRQERLCRGNAVAADENRAAGAARIRG